jgi:hypothetical protein
MMKEFLSVVIIAALLLGGNGLAWATSTQVDSLIEKLVEKGILSKSESIELKGEIAADEKLLREDAFKQSLPEWVRNTKLKGDFRLRYQYERREGNTDARTRARIRYRLGIESDVVKNVKVGAGLSSGGTDPRSTNQTLDNSFERPDVRLDLAYAQFTPNENLKLVGGRFGMKEYLWTPTDLLWDSDINPTGGSVAYLHKFSDTLTGFVNGGVWTIDDKNTSDRPDPFMHVGQSGLEWKKGKFSSKVAGTYYGFNAIKGTTLDNTASTNTLTSSVLQNDYDSYGASAEFGVEKLFGGLPFSMDEKIAVFGDYINNPDPEDDNTGWAAGLRFGHDKVNGKNQWQAKYLYYVLGKDAFPDAFPDSDRISGSTDIKGHEAIFEYGLTKNVIFSLDFINTRRIKAAKNPETIVQADLNFKF